MTPGPEFTWSTRIYYQHTDAGGVVFHSKYLDFMECARTELLQSLGFDLGRLAREEHLLFMVHSVRIDYRRPARLNDIVTVGARVAEAGRARLVFDQVVARPQVDRQDGGGTPELLASAAVTLACVDARTLRPVRVPRTLAAALAARQPDAPPAQFHPPRRIRPAGHRPKEAQ